MLPDAQSGGVSGGIFEGEGGPVLIAGFEDDPGETAWRMRQLAGIHDAGNTTAPASAALQRVHLLDLGGRPLFGPTEADGRAALYNARPGPLAGWVDLWREAELIRPKIIVVDPALSGFVGEANAVAPVSEFLVSLARAAKDIGAGILIVAHSTKATRSPSKGADPFDPGQVSGSSAWTDRARAALSFTWGENAGDRVLAVSKSNYGPARIRIGLDPIRARPFGAGKGAIVGFKAIGTWGASSTQGTAAKAGATPPAPVQGPAGGFNNPLPPP